MIMLWLMSMALSISMIMTSHPMAIMVIILIQTMNICVMAWVVLKMSWFSYIMFLIFLGGLMVLFIYITSLASNEKFEVKLESIMVVMFYSTTIMAIMLMSSFFYKNFSFKMTNLTNTNIMIFTEKMLSPTLIVMTYLLLTLVVAVSIASKFEGPVRNLIKK